MTFVKVEMKGLEATKAVLAGQAKQVRYAASRALTSLAFMANAEIKKQMQAKFKGGATKYSLSAFKVEKAQPQNLTATVYLRDDAPNGGTNYSRALAHLFTSGTREWKRMEGLLRSRKLMPDGYMAVPGAWCPLDSYGNMKRNSFAEMLGVLRSSVRNLRVGYKGINKSKRAKMVGYFIIWPGQKSHLHPGIYRRIEQQGSVVQPFIMYVKRGHWKQIINLSDIGNSVARSSQAEFYTELAKAMRSAR